MGGLLPESSNLRKAFEPATAIFVARRVRLRINRPGGRRRVMRVIQITFPGVLRVTLGQSGFPDEKTAYRNLRRGDRGAAGVGVVPGDLRCSGRSDDARGAADFLLPRADRDALLSVLRHQPGWLDCVSGVAARPSGLGAGWRRVGSGGGRG